MAAGDVAIRVAERLDEEAAAAIEQGLSAYNREHGGESGGRPVAVTVRDRGTGAPVGGLRGRTSYGLLYIDLLFLPPHLRGGGLGGAVVQAAEVEAARRGCTMAMLFTFDFQAPGFYARLGYEEFGRVEPEPPGRARIYMRKRIGPSATPG
jgi:GNAT superfamily N-acetyltransferase